MIWEMALAEFKMRDQGTSLGFLWTLLHPLIYFLVLYNLFVSWMQNCIPDFPLYLIIGFVQWNFFSTATSVAIGVISRYSSFIKSINFPKEVLVISSVLSVLLSHVLELMVLVIFLCIIKGHIGILVLGLLPLIVLSIYLIIAVSFVLATIGVYFLDVSRIWGILMSIGLFLTPIFYSLDMLAPSKRMIIMLNPVTHIISASRDLLIGNHLPAWGGLLYIFLLSTGIFIAGYVLFKSREGHFVEKI